MNRRTLDLIFSIGGTLAALLILVLALVMQNQANFATSYVHNQLAQEKITFTPAAGLKPDENNPCLKTYAGKLMTTGAEAQCYANHYIGVHVTLINKGETYSQTSSEARALAAQLAAMPNQNSAAAKKLSAQVQATQGEATTLFQGETLRGLLLTTYGFSILGQRAQQAAFVCFALGAVLMLAAIAGFIHGASKSAEHEVLPHTT